jgi:hypothetical protein
VEAAAGESCWALQRAAAAASQRALAAAGEQLCGGGGCFSGGELKRGTC